jgi:ribonuclease HI
MGWGGVILISPKGHRLLYVIQLHFRAMNNVAQYEALINGLHITTELEVSGFTSVLTLSTSSTRSWGS